jgi:hypothetical protein
VARLTVLGGIGGHGGGGDLAGKLIAMNSGDSGERPAWSWTCCWEPVRPKQP